VKRSGWPRKTRNVSSALHAHPIHRNIVCKMHDHLMLRVYAHTQAQEFGGWDDSWTSKGGSFDIPVHDGKMAVKLPKWSVIVFQFGS
jgi:hypothetical protein